MAKVENTVETTFEATTTANVEPYIDCDIFDSKKNKTNVFVPFGRAVIGRANSADININDPSTNPIHAVIEVDVVSKTAKIYDMSAGAGVFVNGNQVSECVITKEDKITISRYTLKVDFGYRMVDYTQTGSLLIPQDVSVSEINASLVEPIFNYRFCHIKDTAEVTFLFGDEVLDIRYLSTDQKFFIGNNKKANFLVDLPYKTLIPIVEKLNDKIILNIPKEFSGILRKSNEIFDLESMRNKIPKSTYGNVLEIKQGDFAKLTFHEFSIFIQYSLNPPELISNGEAQTFKQFAIMFLCVLCFMAGLVLYTSLIEGIPGKPEVASLERPPSKIIVIQQFKKLLTHVKPIVKKQIVKVNEKSKPETKAIQKPIVNQPKLARPPSPVEKKVATKSPNKPVTKAPKQVALSKSASPASDQKIVEAKAQAQKRDQVAKSLNFLSSNSSAKPDTTAYKQNNYEKISKGMSKNIGSTTQGSVLAKGSGQNINSGPISTKGSQSFSNVKVGDPSGKTKSLNNVRATVSFGSLYGSGGSRDLSSAIGDQGAGKVSGPGHLDNSAIGKVLERYRNKFQYCYEKALLRNNSLGGRVLVGWKITTSGSVVSPHVKKTDIGDSKFQECLGNELKKITFNPPKGGEVMVDWPFDFSSSAI